MDMKELRGILMDFKKKRKLSKEELDAAFEKFESPEWQAKIKEGFEQIERGEYVEITVEEINQRLRLD